MVALKLTTFTTRTSKGNSFFFVLTPGGKKERKYLAILVIKYFCPSMSPAEKSKIQCFSEDT